METLSEIDELKGKAVFDFHCCVPMSYLGKVQVLDGNTDAVDRFICSQCGKIIDVVEYGVDEGEIENVIISYLEEHPELRKLLE
jgi:hypothetical protein